MQDTIPGEVLRAVFPLLLGQDLAACMCVCKLWREIARDYYLWSQLCAKRWPSVRSTKGSLAKVSPNSYFSLYSRFSRKPRSRSMPAPKLTFEDLEFYLDIWSDEQSIFSTVVPGGIVRNRIETDPQGISETMRTHIHNDTYKLTVAVSPRLSVKLDDCVMVSLLVRRLDDERVACIVDKAGFDYVDGHGNLAHAYEYLQISPLYPFVSNIRVWVAMLLLNAGEGESQEVFGIELDFPDVASTDNELLCLLEILDWKSID
ncbi:hypothetical protein MPTK1_6g18900 [Marchantia polymorpha subsp. ruderalis]|uniref:F-box domain-containing protein n=2 Tax=Marchantia polymorpha TaxID=3197 RepID=A0AAF6BTL3_MARPO|nr:hypothetical protein MARPO_0038s0100 [Marchantia polymorpha]BBN15347.1 hypothetical protein Mp_6g18900 [Marchantia polymorpha subsp. ruderalis]|eukprot:PTQ40780.1 hypothetical protein MARPO_0038s0100 [Marchantia polymorpha]